MMAPAHEGLNVTSIVTKEIQDWGQTCDEALGSRRYFALSLRRAPAILGTSNRLKDTQLLLNTSIASCSGLRCQALLGLRLLLHRGLHAYTSARAKVAIL